jgi:ABC transporter integral membrane subunit
MFKYKDIIKEFVIRDIKIKYRKSYLGILWSLLNPLLTMVVMTSIFSTIFKSNIKNFAVYLLSGQIVVMYFNEATNQAMLSIISNSQLIRKIYIPKYLLCISKIISSGVSLLASLIALLIVCIATGVKIDYKILFSIFPIFYLMIFSLGMGYILATLAVFFRDITHIYGVIMLLWSYFTPTFYPVEILPDNLKILIDYNPLAIFSFMMRDIVLYNKLPSIDLHIKAIIFSIIILILGILIFKRNENKFILNL